MSGLDCDIWFSVYVFNLNADSASLSRCDVPSCTLPLIEHGKQTRGAARATAATSRTALRSLRDKQGAARAIEHGHLVRGSATKSSDGMITVTSQM